MDSSPHARVHDAIRDIAEQSRTASDVATAGPIAVTAPASHAPSHRIELFMGLPDWRASEILADCWTLLIVRELLLGSRHFNEISRGLPGISRSLLVSRLRLLEDGGVVERACGEKPHHLQYQLTAAGDDLRSVVDRFGAWGVRWAFGEPKPEELDPALLVWRMHQRLHHDRLPPRRTVIEFDFAGKRGRRLWLVLTPREVSVCLKSPGFDSDLIVHADLAAFYGVWLGKTDYDAAIRCGSIVIEGPARLAREFPSWFKWSPMSVHVRAERERREASA